jgi:hypothetical protein
MKKLLLVAVSAFALTLTSQTYAHGLDVDFLSNNDGNGNDGNIGSVVGDDNDHNKVGSNNDGNGNTNKSGNAVQGDNNDDNTITDLNIDDIDVHVKIDASKRIAKSDAEMNGYVTGNKVNNGGLNVNAGFIAKQSAGNSIRTGGVSQTGGFSAGINVQQAATGFNNLNQAQVQVSAQASFNSGSSE